MPYDTELNLRLLHLQVERLKFPKENMSFASDEFAIFADVRHIHIGSRPTHLDMAVFCLCLDGQFDVIVNHRRHTIRKNCYMILLPGQVAYFPTEPHNIEGIFFCVNRSLYNQMIRNLHEMIRLFFFVQAHPVATLLDKDIQWLRRYYKLLFDEMQNTENAFRSETVQNILSALVWRICDLYVQNMRHREPTKTRQEDIFLRFINTLSQHYKEHHELQFYADQLCLTAKHLSTTVKQVSGQSAADWVKTFLMQEAKLMLSSSLVSVQEIAKELHFPSQSFFGKYFKHQTGMSPQQWRHKHSTSNKHPKL